MSGPRRRSLLGAIVAAPLIGWPAIAARRRRGDGFLHVDDFGARGDGATDDSAAINAASARCLAEGVGELHFTAGRTYRIAHSLEPRRNLHWRFNGARIACSTGVGMVRNATRQKPIGSVIHDVEGPTDRLTLSSVAGLAAGDWVAIRLGNNPWDIVEPRYAVAAQVKAIAGNTITIDWTIPHSIPIVSASEYQPANGPPIRVAPATTNNRSVARLADDFPINLRFSDGELVGDSGRGVEGGFYLNWGVGLRFTDMHGNLNGVGEMGAGLFGLLQFCRDIRIDRPTLNANANTRGQGSFGRMFNLSNCIGFTIDRPVARNLQSLVGFFESFCEEGLVRAPVVHVTATTARKDFLCFFVGQGSQVRIEDPTVFTDFPFAQMMGDGGADGKGCVAGLVTWRGPMARVILYPAFSPCRLDYADGADAALVDFTAPQRVSVRVEAAGRSRAELFAGPLLDASVRLSGGAGLTGVYLGWAGNNGTNHLGLLRGGRSTALPANIGGIGLHHGGFARLVRQSQLLLTTDGTPGAVVELEGRVGRVIRSSLRPG